MAGEICCEFEDRAMKVNESEKKKKKRKAERVNKNVK